MKCPHCLVSFHEIWQTFSMGFDAEGNWAVSWTHCPTCHKQVVILGKLISQTPIGLVQAPIGGPAKGFQVRPKTTARVPLPPEVPDKFANDYREASLVFPDSAKASAALSRRCLQNLLRDHGHVKPSNLDNEIQQVLDSGKLPTDLGNAIDAVRVAGNFAAHPIKSTNTGEIIDVETGEAEWLLDTIEALFDFYFVRPEALKKKRDALNKKLADAGKPPLK